MRYNRRMYIFQPDRYLLVADVKAAAPYIQGKVLDVGAGHFDRYSNYFSATQYTKMDVHAGENVDVVGTADHIPFPAESFDSVVCTQVFEHLAFPFESAKEIARVLKPGGHLLVTVPQANELHEEPYDFFRYTPFGLESLFSGAGFSVVLKRQRGGFFAFIAQFVFRYMIDRFSLYKRPLLGGILSKFFSVFGRLALWLDRRDSGKANRKHAIGWCYVFQK